MFASERRNDLTPRARWRWTIVAVVTVLAASCAPGTDSAGTDTGPKPEVPTGATSTAAGITDTPACEEPDALSLGDDLFFREVGSSGRQYQLYIPTSYRADRPIPLVLDFHPATGNTSLEEQFNGFEEVAEKAGFVLARPQAASPAGAPGPIWSLYGSEDVEYVEAVVADVRSVVCVDPDRIYAAGMSQGGHFATRLTCRLPGTFAAVASVAVLDHPIDCSPPPTPIIAFAGRKDHIYDIEEGLDPSIFESTTVGAPPGALPGALRDEADAWASTNGCKPEPIITPLGETVQRLRYRCPKHLDTVIYVHDGGHVWPGPWLDPEFAEQLGIGPATEKIDATWTIWKFFKQHRAR